MGNGAERKSHKVGAFAASWALRRRIQSLGENGRRDTRKGRNEAIRRSTEDEIEVAIAKTSPDLGIPAFSGPLVC